MKDVLGSLARRRTALVARSTRQRGEISAAAAGMQRAATEPVLLGLGAAVALFGGSARLRGWFVRAWVAASFVRRMLR